MNRPEALLVTPLPPLPTGLATYAERVLRGTVDIIDWQVAHTPGSDPSILPEGIPSLPVSELTSVPRIRIFQLGNSPDCFEVLQALYRFGGTGLFHETHLHHMIRHGCLERGLLDDYRRELLFEYGPSARLVEKILARPPSERAEYDSRLKRYPLSGRAINACSSMICLNRYAASNLERWGRRVFVVGHPLSPLTETDQGGARPGSPVIGMAGGFNYGRHLDLAIEAVRTLRRRYPNAVLLLAGGGYPDELPAWVTSTGRLSEMEYQAAIRTIDLALDIRHPPLGETSGSLLEVMRAGIPAVVSASGAFLELPSDAVLRVPVEDLAAGAAAALDTLLKRPELMASMSRAAVSWAENQGSWERMRTEWTGLMEALAVSGDEPLIALDRVEDSRSPAWHDPPEGFRRDCTGSAVSWRFEGTACLKGPGGTDGAWVTARGSGSVSGSDLSGDYRVIETGTPVIRFEGSGEVSNIYWFRR